MYRCMSLRITNYSIIFTLVFMLSVPALYAQGREYDEVAVLDAATVLPGVTTHGENYFIDPNVKNDGFTNFFTINTQYGVFSAETNSLVLVRLKEINAIRELKEMGVVSGVTTGAVDKAVGTVDAAVYFASDPVGSVSKIPGGMKRMFSNASRTSEREQSAGEDSGMREVFGIAANKRKLALELGVDPYSSNEVLQRELLRQAKLQFYGKVGVGVAMIPVPAAVAIPIAATPIAANVSQAIASESPENLIRINSEKLAAIGIDAAAITMFMQSPNYSPTHKTIITHALADMQTVNNKAAYMAHLHTAVNEADARLRMEQVLLYLQYHTKVGPLAAFHRIVSIPFVETADGKLVFMGAIDYMTWNRDLASVLNGLPQSLPQALKNLPRHIWITGQLSPMARKNLASLGYSVQEGAGQALS